MKRSLIAVFFALLVLTMMPGALFSGVVVDCGGMTYSNLMAYVSNLNLPSVQAIIISSPFKSYEKTLTALDGPVYDFNDAGGKFQRGSVPTFLGDESALRDLAQYLWTRNIGLYAKVDLFHQKKGYNRNFWKDEGFIQDLMIYENKFVVDIGNASGRNGLSRAIGGMRNLPVQKWVVDVRDIPSGKRHDYVQFLAGNLGSSVVILSDGDQSVSQVAYLEDYYSLRTNAFSTLTPDFQFLEKFRSRNRTLHYIENESPLVNNTGPLMMLLLQNENVMMSYKMLNRFHQSLIEFIREFGGYTIERYGNDKLLIYNQDKLIAVNYSDSFASWKQKKRTWRKGFFKAIESGAVLSLNEKEMSFFLFPKSIAFWDLRK